MPLILRSALLNTWTRLLCHKGRFLDQKLYVPPRSLDLGGGDGGVYVPAQPFFVCRDKEIKAVVHS